VPDKSRSSIFCWDCGRSWTQLGHEVILGKLCICGVGATTSIDLKNSYEHVNHMHLPKNYILFSSDGRLQFSDRSKVVWTVFS